MPWWRRDWNPVYMKMLSQYFHNSKLMPWWRRDWNSGEAWVQAFQPFPSKLMPWWRRDWNSVASPPEKFLCSHSVNWCPDEEGIETHRNESLDGVGIFRSKLMPWWRRDWNTFYSFWIKLLRMNSKLMPWWRRDWNTSSTRGNQTWIVEPVNWCPDEEGIETMSMDLHCFLQRIAVNWCPDEEGIETYFSYGRWEPLRGSVNWCPDEEGIETFLMVNWAETAVRFQ